MPSGQEFGYVARGTPHWKSVLRETTQKVNFYFLGRGIRCAYPPEILSATRSSCGKPAWHPLGAWQQVATREADSHKASTNIPPDTTRQAPGSHHDNLMCVNSGGIGGAKHCRRKPKPLATLGYSNLQRCNAVSVGTWNVSRRNRVLGGVTLSTDLGLWPWLM